MSKSLSLIVVVLLFGLQWFPDAVAATYKCVDANGDVTYSQTPCKRNQTTDKKLSGNENPIVMEDCKYSGAFAQLAFRHMRSGLNTQQLYDRYGGINSISQATLGVINYVYAFKHSTAMRPARVAELTIARCNAQAFGKVSCEDFPMEFQEMIFSCDDEERAEAMRLQKLIGQSVGPSNRFRDSTIIDTYGSNDRQAGNREWLKAQERSKHEREQARIIECKRRYESEIDGIDDRMSRGYGASLGESLRDRRRSLVRKLAAECQ